MFSTRRHRGVHRRLHHRMTTWLAIAAMVMGALAPALAQAAVATAGQSEWVEICSVSGLAWVKTDGTDLTDKRHPAGPSSADGAMKCPWCGAHGHALGLPPPLEQAGLLEPGPQALPGFAVLHSASALWRGAHARAPPFSA